MPIFISHSVAPRELALVNGVADVVAERGETPIIPDRDWDSPAEPLPSRITAQIRSSDYVIAIASRWGRHINWLNQEIIYSQQLLPPSPFLIVADVEVPVAQGYACIRINRSDPLATLSQVSSQIQRLVQDREMQSLLKGFLVGGLALLFLSSLEESK